MPKLNVDAYLNFDKANFQDQTVRLFLRIMKGILSKHTDILKLR